MSSNVLLAINDLHIGFRVKDEFYDAVDGVSLTLRKNEVLAIVGESGCGKSTLATAIIGLHDRRITRVQGEIVYNSMNIASLSDDQFNDIRGQEISMIFQDPLSALNPLTQIGDQMEEALKFHTDLSANHRKRRVLELLEQVGIQHPKRVVKQYPHELSGGMRQRVMIAIAISCSPSMIIADEPTTALDVTIQARIVDLLKDIQEKSGAGILLITHDLGVVAEIADRVAVMYAGEIIEVAPVEQLYKQPKHPYTRSLFHSIPQLEQDNNRLKVIEGMVPSLVHLPRSGCRFSSRIPWISLDAHEQHPTLHEVSPGHFVRCTCWQKFYFKDRFSQD